MRSRSSKVLALAAFAALLALFAAACGGTTQPAASSESPERARESTHATGEAERGESDEASASPAPPRATCDDGTCSPCGNALCPTGWYCDETAPGGPSCGWLPECAQKSGCACLKKGLGCSCEEKNGGTYVSCK